MGNYSTPIANQVYWPNLQTFSYLQWWNKSNWNRSTNVSSGFPKFHWKCINLRIIWHHWIESLKKTHKKKHKSAKQVLSQAHLMQLGLHCWVRTYEISELAIVECHVCLLVRNMTKSKEWSKKLHCKKK